MDDINSDWLLLTFNELGQNVTDIIINYIKIC